MDIARSFLRENTKYFNSSFLNEKLERLPQKINLSLLSTDFSSKWLFETQQTRQRVKFVDGILEPACKGSKGSDQFQIVTASQRFSLYASQQFEELFKDHLWERFKIKGILTSNNVILVRSAFLIDEKIPFFDDQSKHFDLEHYNKMIRWGFHLRPAASEVA